MGLLWLASTQAYAVEDEIRALYRPPQTENAALSPDGRYLAYGVRAGSQLNLCIVDVGNPLVKVTLDAGNAGKARRHASRTAMPPRFSAFQWFSSEELVYGVTAIGASRDETRHELRLVRRDGTGDRKLIDQDDVAELIAKLPTPGQEKQLSSGAITLADIDLSPDAIPRTPRLLPVRNKEYPDSLYVQAAGGRIAVSEVFRVDVTTGAITSLGWESAPGRYLHDQFGRARLRQPATRRMSVVYGMAPLLRPSAGAAFQDLDTFFGATERPEFRVDREHFYEPHSFPIAIDGVENRLYILSNLGRNSFGLYAVDLHTKVRTPLHLCPEDRFDAGGPEDALNENIVVRDHGGIPVGVRHAGLPPRTTWFEPDLAGMQEYLDRAFPARSAEIVNFDTARRRFLVLVRGATDPGRYFVVRRGDTIHEVTEFLRVAPWLNAADRHATTAFSFVSRDGVPLNGWLTVPKAPRGWPAPLVVLCHDIPGRVKRSTFGREAQALAAQGFAVAQVYYRGTAGFGSEHRDAARSAPDRIPIADIRAAIEWLAARHRVSRRRVALVGEGFGGYLAVSAVQQFPKEFRCAITVDAPSALAPWIQDPRPAIDAAVIARRQEFFRASRDAVSLVDDAARISRPVFVICTRQNGPVDASHSLQLRKALQRAGGECEFLDLSRRPLWDESGSAFKMMTQIGAFLNSHVFDYDTDFGKAEVIE